MRKQTNQRRGQASMEYLIIIGFALSVISILTIVYYTSVDENRYQISSNQITKISNVLVDNAEEIYYLGPPAKTTLKIYFPQSIEEIQISENELNIRVQRKGQFTDIEAYSEVNLTGSLPITPGIKFIEIVAQDGSVCIGESGAGTC